MEGDIRYWIIELALSPVLVVMRVWHAIRRPIREGF